MNLSQQSGAAKVEVNQERTMADLTNRLLTNVPGSYYVDDTCIDCDQCRATAPDFFARDDDSGLSYVHRQPITPQEIAEAEDALSNCPTESIGNDGSDEQAAEAQNEQITPGMAS